MEILLIGGTGNISADCAKRLHEQGHRISVVSRGLSKVPADYRVLKADRKERESMRQALTGAKPEVVINFLGYEVSEVQLDLELLGDRIQQYIFISSATVYAKPPPALPITEATPLGNPFWEYAQKKLACEEWLRAFKGNCAVTIVRPSHTYSRIWVPNPVSSSSFTFATRLQQGRPVFVPDAGENPWTLTAASDFAVGLAGLVGNRRAFGEAYHITSDEVLTWNQIVEQIAEAVGATSPQVVKIPMDFICQVAPQMTGSLKGDKAHPGVFDNSKIKQAVPGFHCRKLFRDGVRESVVWLRAHPEQQNLSAKIESLCDDVIAAWRNHG